MKALDEIDIVIYSKKVDTGMAEEWWDCPHCDLATMHRFYYETHRKRGILKCHRCKSHYVRVYVEGVDPEDVYLYRVVFVPTPPPTRIELLMGSE